MFLQKLFDGVSVPFPDTHLFHFIPLTVKQSKGRVLSWNMFDSKFFKGLGSVTLDKGLDLRVMAEVTGTDLHPGRVILLALRGSVLVDCTALHTWLNQVVQLEPG